MIESSFKKRVVLLDKSVERSFFPENFANEMYHSKSNYTLDDSISYKSNFSIKYILDGKERYFLDGKKYAPKAGQYLLINDGREVETAPLKGSEGISIFLDKILINEVYSALTTKEEQLIDNGISEIRTLNPEFFEYTFNHGDILGKLLEELSTTIKMSAKHKTNLPKEIYYLIAEKLIQSQKNVRLEIGEISRKKKSTREELYKKALVAKDYINDTALIEFNLDSLSRNVGLSKYHLIRVFKSAFSVTPYQYHLLIKVNHAKIHLLNNSFSLETIAYLCGFNDVFSFSKTFKKISGFTPSEFRRGIK